MTPIPIIKTEKQFSKRTILAGDIGATKANVALFQYGPDDTTILDQHTYHTKNFTDIHQLIQAFIPNDIRPEVISLGVAGPVYGSTATLTNLHWTIDAKVLSQQWGSIPVYLLNDIEAAGYGLATLKESNTSSLHEGKEGAQGNIAIIIPGTGLGEAGLFWDGATYHPFATEGGHCDFAPRTPIDQELYTYLQKKFGHVSWERVISGPGIYSIFQFLRDKKEREEPSWLTEKLLMHDPPAVITEYATACPICTETMDLFFRYLAYETANLTLKLKAIGGIFLAGGILRKNIHLLDKHAFYKSYCSSGRLNHLLADVPITIILNEKLSLHGAAHFAAHIALPNAKQHYAPT